MAVKLEEGFGQQAESHEMRLILTVIYQRVLQGPLPMMMYDGERNVIAAQYCRSICYGGRPYLHQSNQRYEAGRRFARPPGILGPSRQRCRAPKQRHQHAHHDDYCSMQIDRTMRWQIFALSSDGTIEVTERTRVA